MLEMFGNVIGAMIGFAIIAAVFAAVFVPFLWLLKKWLQLWGFI